MNKLDVYMAEEGCLGPIGLLVNSVDVVYF